MSEKTPCKPWELCFSIAEVSLVWLQYFIAFLGFAVFSEGVSGEEEVC